MKIKVYLNDWFYNAGIVGFLRILEANDDEFAIKRNNYIEFDTESLRKFHKYYFKYFFQKYNVAENVENRTKNSFDYFNKGDEYKEFIHFGLTSQDINNILKIQ